MQNQIFKRIWKCLKIIIKCQFCCCLQNQVNFSEISWVIEGANGLNIIEATNVLMVEPLLHRYIGKFRGNLLCRAVEQQAINRIHRIGQTQQTKVWRFIVKNTIEEKVFELGRTRTEEPQDGKVKEDISIADIKNLFEVEKPVVEPEIQGKVFFPAIIENFQGNFWEKKVWFNDKLVERKEAICSLERIYSWDCKEKGFSITNEPTIPIFGREIAVKVAKQLLDLNLGDKEEEENIEELKNQVNELAKSEFYVEK